MALNLTIMQAHLKKMIADLPATLTWSGSDYTVTGGDPTSDVGLELASVTTNRVQEWVAEKSSFTAGTYPALGDTITVDSITYRIIRIADGADGWTLQMFCEEEEA